MEKNRKEPKKALPETRNHIVKDIFDKPRSRAQRISTIFTHDKSSAKTIPTSANRQRIPSDLKPLPAAIDIGTSSVKVLRLGESGRKQLEIICADKEALDIPSGSDFSSPIKNALKRIT